MDKLWQLAAIVITLLGCEGKVYPKVLELSDAKLTLSQIERDPEGSLYLHLKGFSFHSSLAVDEVSIKSHQGLSLVIVRLIPVRKGKDGNFDVRVLVSAQDEVVLFGEKAEKVWPLP